jgi:hypothetical protein
MFDRFSGSMITVVGARLSLSYCLNSRGQHTLMCPHLY